MVIIFNIHAQQISSLHLPTFSVESPVLGISIVVLVSFCILFLICPVVCECVHICVLRVLEKRREGGGGGGGNSTLCADQELIKDIGYVDR